MDRNNGSPAGNDVERPAPDREREIEAGAQDATLSAEAATPAPEFEQVKADLQALQDRYLRQAAEYQNYRRRTDQERDALFDMGKAAVLQEMLNILDDLARSVEAAEKGRQQENIGDAYRSLKEGVELVYRKFEGELARLGVTPIEAVGNPFHEYEHEAVMQQPGPEGTEPGTILSEFQKGYKLGDRVLRHSKVVVAS